MKNQILHIFKEDVRHFWREIVLMAAIVVAYGWQVSSHSQESALSGSMIGFSFSSQILSLLVPISFFVLILRAVYAESPVGDRQFWVTRPYDWRHLLVAKLLFVVTFVNLPLFLLQVFLLGHAGFWPPRYIAGLLGLQLLWVAFIFLPVGTLAVVTSGIGQFVLAVLGMLLYLIASAALVGKIPNLGVAGANDIPSRITWIAVFATAAAVIFWQYARRRTARSRIVLLCVAAAVPIFFAVTPYRTIIARIYPTPAPGQALPVQLAFDPAKPASLKGGYPEKNKVHILLPLLVSGVAEGSIVFEGGRMESIAAPGGLRWESRWEPGRGEVLANRPRTTETLTIDKDFFERVKSIPVNVHLTFALVPGRATKVVRVVASAAPFTLPGDGRCSFSPLERNKAVCIFPVTAQFMLLSAKSEEITCAPGENEKPLPAGVVAYGWVWVIPAFGAEFGTNPVSTKTLDLSDFGELKVGDSRGGICPGTPLTVYSDWQDGRRFRINLEIDGIRLADYKLTDSPDEGGGFGVMLP
jgi:hypothetical protein